MALMKRLIDARDAEQLRADRLRNYWGWQGDGEDHLESLVCPVLIHAESLRTIIAERDAARERLTGIEGELEEADYALLEARADRAAAQEACAEMKDVINQLSNGNKDTDADQAAINHALSTDCGRGYIHERDVLPLVEAVRDTLNILLPNLDIVGIKLPHERHVIERAQQALAHWEKVKGQA